MKPSPRARVAKTSPKLRKKAFQYKRFTHVEMYRESSPFDPTSYIEKVCAAGWRPFEVIEGRGEKTDADGKPVPIYYLIVQSTREIEVDAWGPEPESLG
jgi:hypothetical protein